MAIHSPSDPAARRRLVRWQYIAALLVLPKLVELVLRSHFNGSALGTMTPYLVHKGGVDTAIPASSWWFLIIVECLSTVCMLLFFIVLLRIASLARSAGA